MRRPILPLILFSWRQFLKYFNDLRDLSILHMDNPVAILKMARIVSDKDDKFLVDFIQLLKDGKDVKG